MFGRQRVNKQDHFPAQDVDVDNHASWFAPVRHLPNYILLRIRYRIAVSMLDMKATPWSTPDIIGELSPTLRGLRENFGSIPLQPATGKNSVTSQFTLPLRTFATSHLLGRLFILASFATPSHLDAILGHISTHFNGDRTYTSASTDPSRPFRPFSALTHPPCGHILLWPSSRRTTSACFPQRPFSKMSLSQLITAIQVQIRISMPA